MFCFSVYLQPFSRARNCTKLKKKISFYFFDICYGYKINQKKKMIDYKKLKYLKKFSSLNAFNFKPVCIVHTYMYTIITNIIFNYSSCKI